MDRNEALAVCQTCGMPVRVLFDGSGNVEKVLAVCGHVETPVAALPGEERS